MLKKEFTNSSELNRIRNLIRKNYGDATVTQRGFEVVQEEHNEGDIWQENGKSWTIKNGVKINLKSHKVDVIKTPIFCPVCSKSIFHSHDIKMLKLRDCCLDCVVKAETDAKIAGTYKEYEEYHMELNKKTFIEEMISDIDSMLGEGFSEEMAQSEMGDVEKWSGADTSKVIEDIKKSIT